MFKKKSQIIDMEPDSPAADVVTKPSASSEVFSSLDRLQKAGVQLLVRVGHMDAYTSAVLGLARDAFFIDTLSPPSGDRLAEGGMELEVEALLDGVTYSFKTKVLSRVEFLDELPAFRVAYPGVVQRTSRRRSPRIDTHGTASLTFVRPFNCEASVVDISEGGLAFEYPADMGRLKRDMRLGGAILDLGSFGAIELKTDVVGTLVTALGGLSLPSRYRTSIRFHDMGRTDTMKLLDYLEYLNKSYS